MHILLNLQCRFCLFIESYATVAKYKLLPVCVLRDYSIAIILFIFIILLPITFILPPL